MLGYEVVCDGKLTDSLTQFLFCVFNKTKVILDNGRRP